ncbi:hypothetical protein CHGG_02462 [Chaetomium globosum CBS 148.51]|uniref:EKC/KEOPS complex subunit BUD32 n=1 Tax=Chaetomium globosum (strain ATCC 6205 / CBS 148.51 / DSM 1962 / NBRC 6347 / NRRL 1970) TaxID=306901 RepID=Q2HBE2_CHAGB|nr:uncharacterized protein CHGG_02462 [Chaetomium globosum CBS 148.51]EAQ90527.1 hypothetical protein CHGG_02462 [Chaetomium globosum CBS 148.51]
MIPKAMRFYRQGGLLCGSADGNAHHCVYDIDQRQWISVSTTAPWDSPLMRHDHDDAFDDAWEALGVQAEELLAEHIDTVAAGVKGIVVEVSGKLRFVKQSCLGMDYYNSRSTLYPLLELYQLPQGTFKTILRSDIAELDRLSPGVDLVSYAGMEKGVFKYAAYHPNGFGDTWMEFQIQARLPKHPNILPVDCLVLDEQTGKRYIGYTAPFIEGGDLGTNKNRLFKLKHLRQLMEVVDFLNYNLGIVHNDMAPRNLLIDPYTDDLILFDFDVSAKIGYEVAPMERGMSAAIVERNDVKGVVMTVHELLTRDPRYEGVQLHYPDETDLLAGPEKWVKHPEVQLESGVDTVHYYDELMRWVEARRERPITVYTEASDPLEWPRRFRDENNPEEYEINYDRDIKAVIHLKTTHTTNAGHVPRSL